MENSKEKGVLTAATEIKPNRGHKFRDTVLVRLDRNIKEQVKDVSKRTHETMSQIMDWALDEYLKSIKPID